MTKVLVRSRRMICLAVCLLCPLLAAAQPAPDPSCPKTTADLYNRIRTIELDPTRVYRVRDANIDRPNLSLTFENGTLAFTQDICGRITGAFFFGEGEILLRPPNRLERASLALFTGMAILEEQFSSAYLRFNDDTAQRLQPYLSPVPDGAEFVKQWGEGSRKLADYDSLRLLLDFTHFLPPHTASPGGEKFPPLLHAHLFGKKLDAFEVFYDVSANEPLWAGQGRVADGLGFFNIWTSFLPPNLAWSGPRASDVAVMNYRIRATIHPPTQVQASTEVEINVAKGGQRTLIFELSRFLKADSVESGGHLVDFVQNPAIEGTQLQRLGNDLVAVVFPAELKTGDHLTLKFTYGGEVLSDAGNGLLYVGARGSWYPSFGLSPAQFDMEFHYPAPWTLLATGKQVVRPVEVEGESADRVSRWVSDRSIPVAGFNLGRYVRAEARAGNVMVEAYSTKGVEKNFPKAIAEVVQAPDVRSLHRAGVGNLPIVVSPPPPSPARDVQAVADRAANAITRFSQWFGPYPYSSLALTQMPGDLSQGWPGLVFLSSFAFLSPQEQLDLHLDPVTRDLNTQVLVHETAHQWWGDLVLWKSYRDQWLAEGLANYASLLMLEQQNPNQFRLVMDSYRNNLLSKNKDGEWLRDAGPVTLGPRLVSSHFPNGYEAISYQRGTWLFHMLRSMLRDSESAAARFRKDTVSPEEPFFRALRKVRERYTGKTVTTRELIQVFEEELPKPLWYENRHKLDWFMDGWINGTAIPGLAVRDVHFTDKSGTTVASGVIVQRDAPDDLVTAIPVYGETGSNSMVFLGEVLADGAETAFHLKAPANTRKIVLDPNQTILSAPK